jgi:hypothetical protein
MLRQLLFSFLFIGSLRAQKPEKGSSPDNPWNKEVDHGINMELDYRNPPLNYRYSLSFGNWKFESKFFSSARVKSEIPNADPNLHFNHQNAILFSSDSIHVNGMAPGAIPYGLSFTYADSLLELYNQVFLSIRNFEVLHFHRTLQGIVLCSAGDVSPFFISVIYTDTITQTDSYVLAGKDTIFLKAVSNPEEHSVYSSKASGNSYAGFDFYKNDTLVGGAHRKYNFAGLPVYRYWFNPQLDLQQQEAVAAIIFLIAGFIE